MYTRYIPNIPSVPERFRGIAIRVEDIVQITKDKPIVLTKSAPKEISEIEALRM
jgi:Xaa-Pro aminopeptidase